MFVCVRMGVHACLPACVYECVVVKEDEWGGSGHLGGNGAEEFSIHGSILNHPLQCPLPGSDRGGSRDQLPFETCYYYHQRGGRPPSPALIPISSETEGESGPFVSEMFIYAADLPKDMEKPLLQVMTVEPQHMIHFLSFNLVVSMGKFFWSPHPAVKHGHYSIMWELYL